MVTSLPPPCGVRETDRTRTPMVAQSSVEASLMKRLTVPFWGCGLGFGLGDEELLPHPAEKSIRAAGTRPSVRRAIEDFIGTLLRRGRASENLFLDVSRNHFGVATAGR